MIRAERNVTYEVFGDPRGYPVVYFHGFPSSRLEASLHGEVAAECGVRLVAFDRPGLGRSQQADETVTDIARDALGLADRLGLADFGVVGVSGGAPYALACALLAPDRVRGVALMAPMAPPDAPRYGMRPANRLLLALAAKSRPMFAALQRTVAAVVKSNAEGVVKLFSKTLPGRERALVADDALRRAFAEVLREAFAQYGAGATDDGRRLARPWGIGLGDIRTPVRIWHGLLDDIVPPGMGGYLQSALGPDVELTLAPLDGHFSLVRSRIGEALRWLGSAHVPAALIHEH